MKHRRTVAVVAISLAICLTFTGCWDGRELNTISLVAGVGVDAAKGKSGITMTVQVGKTGQTNNGKEKESPTSKYLNYQKSGDTELGIIRELTHETSRRLFFGHNQFIIFGKQEAEKGIKPQLDFFLRDQETRLDVWLLTSDTTAGEILNTESDLSPIPAMDLAQLIANQKANSESVETDILDFTSKMESEGTSPVIGLVKIDRTTKKPKFLLSGMAAFKQDKMVGEMSEPETRGYLWTMNKIHSGTVDVKVGNSGSSLEILEGSGKISPKLDKNNHVSVSIKITAKLGIREMTDLENVAFPKAGMLLQTACEETIQKRVQACFQKSQVYGTDIYGIGKMIDEKNPKQWDSMKNNWEQIYKKIKPSITVQVQVSDPGQINQFKK